LTISQIFVKFVLNFNKFENLNLCVLASGRGSNLKSIIRSQKSGKINSKVAIIISNNSNSGALNIAKANQIPGFHLSQKMFNSEGEYVDRFFELLRSHNVDLIVLAGYMKMIPEEIVKQYRNRILNIHPALIPSFCGKGLYGIHVHEAVLNYGVKVTGVTVHLVDEEYDTGPIVLQKTVKIKDDDTPESLQKRVLKWEHRIFPEAIKLFESKKFNIEGRRVFFT
jgi:phosphoribosylglycinamide formyltransferase-1